jgi:hypothetical protein
MLLTYFLNDFEIIIIIIIIIITIIIIVSYYTAPVYESVSKACP